MGTMGKTEGCTLSESKELCEKIDGLTRQLNSAIKEASGKGLLVLGEAMMAGSDLYPNKILCLSIATAIHPKDIEGE